MLKRRDSKRQNDQSAGSASERHCDGREEEAPSKKQRQTNTGGGAYVCTFGVVAITWVRHVIFHVDNPQMQRYPPQPTERSRKYDSGSSSSTRSRVVDASRINTNKSIIVAAIRSLAPDSRVVEITKRGAWLVSPRALGIHSSHSPRRSAVAPVFGESSGE